MRLRLLKSYDNPSTPVKEKNEISTELSQYNNEMDKIDNEIEILTHRFHSINHEKHDREEQEDNEQNYPQISRSKIENFLENVYDPEDESAPSGVAQLSDYEAWVLVQALKKIDDLTIRIYDAVEQEHEMAFMKAQQIY